MSQTEFILQTQDCIAGMKALPAASVDVVVTSPPYNLGIKSAPIRMGEGGPTT